MKVSSEQIENSQVALNVEMEADDIDEYMDRAYKHLVGRVRVPGFRKGKTPRAVLERHVGKDAFLQEALDHLVPEAYEKALDEQKIEPIARPEIQLIQDEPVIFKAIVPVRPKIKLGDYATIRLESELVEVEEKEIDAAIEQIRYQHAVLLPVDRAVKLGDTVTMDLEGESQGESFPIRKDFVYELIKESPLPLPGFANKLEGIAKGEEKSFVLSYPADYEIKELAGKEYSFKVKVTEIKERELPEVNDEFAVGLGNEDLASLKEHISAQLKTRADEKARLNFEQMVVDAVVELSDVEYPPVLVENEMDRLLEEESRNFAEGVKGLENYLKSVDKTMEDHREELRSIAEKRIVRSLVLGEIAEVENITVDDSEVDSEIEKMVSEAGEQGEEVRKLFNFPQSRKSVEQYRISQKTVERLTQIASGLD